MDQGIVPVLVPPRSKKPMGGDGWQMLRPTRDEVAQWPDDHNLGALLGEPSGWRVDVDLDTAEAIELAPFYLPETWTFGRRSKPRSHPQYIARGAQTRQFKHDGIGMIVELRSTGGQTIWPGSTHESGEIIEWDPDCCDAAEGPREVDAADLLRRVANLACAAIARHAGLSIEESITWERQQRAPEPRQRRTSTFASSSPMTRAELAERIKAAKAGKPFREPPKAPEAPGVTLRQLAEKFKLEGQPDVWHRERYLAAFWSDFATNVDPYLGGKVATAIKRTDVAAWREKMKADGKSARTIKRGMSAASVLFNWALELGHLPDEANNPVEKVSKPTYKPERELYSPEEVARLLAEAAKTSPELHRLVAFAFFTGARVGEIAALTWGDIDFAGHSVNVHRSFDRPARKNGRAVVVGLNPHLRDILGPLASADDAALVFPRADGAMRPKYDSKHGCWGIRDLATRAKVRKLKQPWHSFRASHATALEEQGATPSDIMRALGQSSIGVAMHYAQASSKRAAERVAAIPAIGPAKASNVTPITEARRSRAR